MIARLSDDKAGRVAGGSAGASGSPATPGRVDRAGGEIGEDTRKVLREYLALSEGDVDALLEVGAISCGRRRSGACGDRRFANGDDSGRAGRGQAPIRGQ